LSKVKDELENIAIYINHSQPNVVDYQITYVVRDIKTNEELCIDYAMADTD
jgi:SET domain-containing protein